MASAQTTTDALQLLEDKIRRAGEQAARMREERDAAVSLASEAEGLRQRVEELTSEVEALRAEREAVRKRVGKLLEQVDALSAV